MGLFSFFRRKRSQKKKGARTTWRLQIVSDLHLEVGRQYASFDIPATAPYLKLAGDIGRLADYDALLHDFLARFISSYRRIFHVLGNHEFYGMAYEAGIEAARRLEGEPCLDGKLTVLHYVRKEAQAIVQSKLTDFRKIEGWTMAQNNKRHAQEVAWLRKDVAYTGRGQEQGPLCVITHHAPSLKATSSPKNATNAWTSDFATELLGDGSGVWSTGVQLWVFGHTHHCVDDLNCHGVHLVANQRGYALPWGGEETEARGKRAFNPGLAIEM